MSLAKKFRRIANLRPDRERRQKLRCFKAELDHVLEVCRSVAYDGRFSYDWSVRHDEQEKIDFVCNALRKKGFVATVVYADQSCRNPDHIQIGWGE